MTPQSEDDMILHTLKVLHTQKRRVDSLIAELEAYNAGGPPPNPHKRAGRKSMGAEERKAVGERMKNYWATRRGTVVIVSQESGSNNLAQ